MLNDVLELLPAIVAGTAVLLYIRSRRGQVKTDLVAMASGGIVVLGSLLMDIPVDVSSY